MCVEALNISWFSTLKGGSLLEAKPYPTQLVMSCTAFINSSADLARPLYRKLMIALLSQMQQQFLLLRLTVPQSTIVLEIIYDQVSSTDMYH